MIESFLPIASGDIFVANGIDNPKRWDGFLPAFEDIGLAAPTAALTVGGSGVGAIVGAYFAFERFLDDKFNPSDLSPISAQYTAQGTTGTITDATNASPIVITSTAHGLTNGTTVKIAGVGGNTSANNTWLITVVDANTFSLDDSHGTAAYSGGGTWISGISTISYSSVQVPVEAKVARRQILRNTDGQATTFYVDVDTADLSATSFTSTRTDAELATQEAVPILDSSSNVFANRNGKPLNYFPYLAQLFDRVFATGQVEYSKGSCKVTFGSTTVTGVGTGWKATLATRFFYATGADKAYEIDSVSESAQTLTLTLPYQGPTNKFAFYAIKPPPAYRRILAWSAPGFPQSWLATDQISIQDTGDEISGIMQHQSFVYVLEKRHIHKLTFSVGPKEDGGVFMLAQRGCINNRCWAIVDEDAYMLDELGVHKFSGKRQVEPQSLQIQSIFRSDEGELYRINWRWAEYFHCVLDRQREVIKWFVSLDGNRYPKHCIVLQYRTERWWIEKHPFPVGGACAGFVQQNRPQVFYGCAASKIFSAWIGTTDVVNSDDGVIRSIVTSATAFTLTDAGATWPTTGMVNAPIHIHSGRGKGQERKIVSASGKTLRIDRPWSILPDATSAYQVGGVSYLYRSAWLKLAKAETMAQRRLEILYEALPNAATMDVRFRQNFGDVADRQAITKAAEDGRGFASTESLPDLTLDLTHVPSIAVADLPSHKTFSIQGKDYINVELEGVTNRDAVKVFQISYEGAIPEEGLGQE